MSKMKKEMERKRRATQCSFLLTFFDGNKQGYEEKMVNGYWLVKSWNPEAGYHQVAIFPQDSFQRYKEYNEGQLGMTIEDHRAPCKMCGDKNDTLNPDGFCPTCAELRQEPR